ncbi:MAG: lmo0937 family membrane protein [Bacteroidota bacterium]
MTNNYNMQNYLYPIAVILVILWGLGFFIFNTGNAIHLLFFIAVIAIIVRLIKGNEI